MATIKERAKQAGLEIAGWNDTLRQGFEAGYEIGAREQRKIDIDNACEAFCIESKCRNRVNLACRETCEKLKCFREAMEGKV